jgi:hypothetical protein
LREAYRYTQGRASEEYECYVIPEEEDEEEAADVFCVTCKTPVRADGKNFDDHREHEVTPLNKALESAKVRRPPWLVVLMSHPRQEAEQMSADSFFVML